MDKTASGPPAGEQFRTLLAANPSILTEAFEKLAAAAGLPRAMAREFLKKGRANGNVRVQVEGRRTRHLVWTDGASNA